MAIKSCLITQESPDRSNRPLKAHELIREEMKRLKPMTKKTNKSCDRVQTKFVKSNDYLDVDDKTFKAKVLQN